MIWIKIFKDRAFVGLKSSEGPRILLGSSPAAEIHLDDASVAPIAAILEKKEQGYLLHEMKNAKNFPIKEGDEFSFENYTLSFHYKEPPKEEEKKTDSIFKKNIFSKEKSSEVPLEKKEVPKKEAPKASPKKEVSHPQKGPASKKGTFAPPSAFSHSDEIIKPREGTQVEVIVTWKERVLTSYHFEGKRSVKVGSGSACDVKLPPLGFSKDFTFLKVNESKAEVLIPPGVNGELFQGNKKESLQGKGRAVKLGESFSLISGQMIRADFGQEVHIYVRFKQSEKPKVAGLLGMSQDEALGIVASLGAVFLFWVFMNMAGILEEEKKPEEKIRRAVIKFPPSAKRMVISPDPTPTQVVQVTPNRKKKSPKAGKKSKSGKMGGSRGRPTKRKIISVARKAGGSVKTGKQGGSPSSKKPDPTKVGLLGVLGTKGAQKDLKDTYTGLGDLQGLADKASGFSGSKTKRPGSGIGTNLRGSVGLGKGKSTIGNTTVSTKGKGTGQYGYGTGSIGDKSSVEISVGGEEASFSGNIDRNAIYRVIQAHKREIRVCYEKELSRDRKLYGKLVLQWDIIERGRVRSPKVVSNTLGNERVGRCVISRLITWKFPDPPPQQAAQVVFPFVFSSTSH